MKKPTSKGTIVLCTAAALLATGLARWFLAPVASQPEPNGSDDIASHASTPATVSALLVSAPRQQKTVPANPSDQMPAAPASEVTPSIAASPQPAAPATPPAIVNVGEESATVQMYLAHSSLREREVANPDSEANRRILQAMVTKAISTPASGVSAVAPATN